MGRLGKMLKLKFHPESLSDLVEQDEQGGAGSTKSTSLEFQKKEWNRLSDFQLEYPIPKQLFTPFLII